MKLNMKKILGMLLAIWMAIASLGSALADGEMYGKDIQFSGHTFGETFLTARKAAEIDSISFDTGRAARYSRMLADPAASGLSGLIADESDVPYLFSVRTRMRDQTVAGHRAQTTLYFMYPTQEAAQNFELNSATLYGATYEFYDGSASDTFQDLKKKLSSVYGTPFAENANTDEVWGALLLGRDDIEQETIDREYQEGLDRNRPISYVAWKSSTNNGLIMLVNYHENGDWERTSLHYFDLSTDETIVEMFSMGSGASASDSIEGL